MSMHGMVQLLTMVYDCMTCMVRMVIDLGL
jgi:hypothetical protein